MKYQQPPNYIKGLDGLRGVSVLLVIFFHASLLNAGWIGVQIFFVLSGYLIGGILLKLKDNGSTLWENLKTFELRRVFRIFPVYYLYLLFLILYGVMKHSGMPDRIWFLLTYTGNYAGSFNGYSFDLQTLHLWTLSVEEQFYCFFPLLILLIPQKWVCALLVSLVVLSPLFRWLYAAHLLSIGRTDFGVGIPVQWHTISQLDAFSFGALIHVLSLDRLPQKISAGILAFLVAVAAVLDFRYGHVLGSIDHYQPIWVSTFLNVLSIFLITVIVSTRYLDRLLTLHWLVEIGKVSYGAYVFHIAFLMVYFKVVEKYHLSLPARYGLCVATIVALYFFCRLLFRYFETPFLRLKPGYRTGTREKKGSLYVVRGYTQEGQALSSPET